MAKILAKTLSAFLYLVSVMFLMAGMLMLYAAYRDSDFKLSLFGLVVIVGAKIGFDAARKK